MFVTFWKPVVVAAATTMNTPRRSSAIKSEKPPEAHVEAISVIVATISQMAPVRISKSRKKESVSPRWVIPDGLASWGKAPGDKARDGYP